MIKKNMTAEEVLQALRNGETTVNEIADAEEAGQLEAEQLFVQIENYIQIKEHLPYEAITIATRDTLNQIDEGVKRYNKSKPFIEMLREKYDKETPIFHEPPWVLLSAIEIFAYDRRLEDATKAEKTKHKEDFLTFFAAFLQEWTAVSDKTNREEAETQAWNAMRDRGLLSKGRLHEEAAEHIYKKIAESQETAETITAIEGFFSMYQGPVTNNFALARATKDNLGNATVDNLTGIAQIEQGKYTIYIDDFNQLTRGLTDTAHMLFNALKKKFTESPPKDKIIRLSLREYMELRGLKDEKEARKQIKEDLEALRNCHMNGPKGYGTAKGEGLQFYFFGGSVIGIRNSVIHFSISDTFYYLLLEYPLGFYPQKMFRIDTTHYKHAYALNQYIYEIKRINLGKEREDIYSVKSLLKACANLPAYEELDKSKGEITRKIIEPFLKSINHLEDLGLFTWGYCHSKGEPLTLEEAEQIEAGNMTYALFESLSIKVDFKEYPTPTKTIENRNKHIEATNKATARAEKKKLEKAAEKKLGLE